MADNRIARQTKLDELYEKLTEGQRKFLDARRYQQSDGLAAEASGCSPQSVPRWKKAPTFMKAYTIITLGDTPKGDELVLYAKDKDAIKEEQLDALIQVLPQIVQEHIRIALWGGKEVDRLRALERIEELVGLTPKDAPEGKQSQVFINMLTLMMPQVRAEAQRRGLPISSTMEDVIDGAFEPLLDVDDESDGIPEVR